MSETTNTTTPTSGERAPVLQVDGLNIQFWVDGEWVTAAEDVTYRVMPGEVLAIVGESGSGKSTSSMSLLGLLPANGRASGSAMLDGEQLIGAKPERMRQIRGEGIAVIFQEPMTALNPVYRIGFQICESLQVHNPRMTRAEAKVRALELLGMVEMPDPQKAFDSYPHQLSGGQRQRAMIAQSISCDPRLLIADEPTTALDVTVQAEILDLIRNLHKRLDSAVVLITHDMGVVADLADHIMVMKDGKVVETGAIRDVFSNAQHPYTRALLAAVPHLGAAPIEVVEPVPAAEAAVETRDAVLSFENVAIDYPKRGRMPVFRAAENIDLQLYPGEIVGLVGESGSGKTTLGRAAIGLIPVAEGKLSVVGQDISSGDPAKLRAIRRRTGIVFQDPGSSLNPRFPIGESIGEPLLLSGEASGAELDRRVETLLDQVELPRSYRNRYPHELSGGQRQRVGIARALALTPELLVADEPTSALDVSVQARFLELLQGLQQELGFACLFVSHDLAVVDILAHRIAVMRRGRLVEVGTRDQILRAPKDDYTRRLIDAVPVPDPDEQARRRGARRTA